MNKFVKILTFILIFLTMSINVLAMEVGNDSLKNISSDIPQIGSEVEDLPAANYIRLFGDINKVEDVYVENSKIVFRTKDDGYTGLNGYDFKLTDDSKFFVVFKYAKDNSYASIQEINYIDFDSLIESKENLGDENYFPRVYIESNKGFFKENLTCSYIVYFLEDNSYIEKELNNYAPFVGKEVDKSNLDTLFVDKVGSFGDIEYFRVWINYDNQLGKRISIYKSVFNEQRYIYQDTTAFCIVFSDEKTGDIIKVKEISDEEFSYIVNNKINYGKDTYNGEEYFPEVMIGYNSKPLDRPFLYTVKTCYINYYVDSGDDGESKPFIKEEVVKDIYDYHINDTDYENNRNPNFILRNLEQVEEPSLLDYNTFISAKNISETKVFNTVSEMNYYIKINTGENFHLKSEAGKTSFYVSVGNKLTDVYYDVGNHTYLFDKILKKVLEDKTMYNVKEILVSSDSDDFEGKNIVILFLETK